MIQLALTVHGVFALKNDSVIAERRFKSNPEEIASKLVEARESILPEEEDLLSELVETGNKSFMVDKPRRYRGFHADVEFKKAPHVDLGEFSEKIGIPWVESRKLLREVNLNAAAVRLRELEPDQLIIQAVDSLDEIQGAANLLNERLREWYSLYFPELDYLVEGNEAYSRLTAKYTFKESFEGNMGLDQDHAQRILKSRENSLGVKFSESDLGAVKKMADASHSLYGLMKETQGYVESKMSVVAPNLTKLVGAELAARLISHAGSLKRLAVLPAGTIQVLGAEDAFFRFMKTGRRPPKHGIIFQYPDIRGAKKKIRGKLARSLAAKIAIAARADAFGGSNIAPKLLKDFNKRVKSLS